MPDQTATPEYGPIYEHRDVVSCQCGVPVDAAQAEEFGGHAACTEADA